MIGIKKSVSQWHSARSGDHYSRTSPISGLACHPHTGVSSTLPGIYRPRSFVLVKRIINTYNGFLTSLPHPMLLFCRATRPLRGIRDGATFFLRLHFSPYPLRSHSVLNMSLPKRYTYSYRSLISVFRASS